MNTRRRFRYGCLTRKQRRCTEDVWTFRYYETTAEGRRCQRSKFIGTLSQYPTQADALRVVERLRVRLNMEQSSGRPITLDALIDHYIEKELPRLRYGTQQGYRSSFKALDSAALGDLSSP